MQITYYGHSAIRIETGRSQILVDPFLTGNPAFEESGLSAKNVGLGVTHIVLTHGHDDHVGDTVDIAKASGATVIAPYELALYLNGTKGVENVDPVNPGGALTYGDVVFNYVKAFHSSSTMVDGAPVYLGAACGVVIQAEGHAVYHMGDTDIFSGMELIQEMFEPEVGFVPIGDRFTMGAKNAALACKRYFKFDTVVPVHYGTFPIIDPTADDFIGQMEGQNVVVMDAGQTLDV